MTINDAGYYNLDKNDAEDNQKSAPKVDTHTSDEKERKVTETTNRNPPQKLLSNRTLPIITTLIDPWIPDGIETCGGTPHVRPTPTSKVVITDVTRSSVRIFQTHAGVSKKDRDGTTPHNCNTSIKSPRLKSPVTISGGTTVSPTRTGSQDIVSPKRPTISVEVRDT